MYTTRALAALLAAAASAHAFQGFNYGATFTNGAVKTQQDFEAEFRAAADLAGTNGDFSSARLYTMIQGGSQNDPISAIEAAINTRTTLLLGLWASAGSAAFANELRALERTIEQYGDQLEGLIAGISVGSEDLYRISPIGIAANSNPGAEPATIIDYIGQVRNAVQGSPLASAPIGHVDTSTAWFNASNVAVAEASDFVGFNAFAYFEDTQDNAIGNGKALFDRALQRTRDAVGDKPIWITETGWPVSGDTVGNAVASTQNAETFWQDVGCPLFGETNVWWYILRYSPTSPSPDFGVIGADINSGPRFDLSCSAPATTSSAGSTTRSTSTASTASTASAASAASAVTVSDTVSATSAVGATGTAGQPEPQPTDDDSEGDDDTVSTVTAVIPPGQTGGDDSEDGGVTESVEAPAAPTSTPTETETETAHGGDHNDGIVPGPPPSTLSVAPSPTGGAGGVAPGNGSTSAPAEPSASVVEPASASAMSFSAAFLAMMLAVALF